MTLACLLTFKMEFEFCLQLSVQNLDLPPWSIPLAPLTPIPNHRNLIQVMTKPIQAMAEPLLKQEEIQTEAKTRPKSRSIHSKTSELSITITPYPLHLYCCYFHLPKQPVNSVSLHHMNIVVISPNQP